MTNLHSNYDMACLQTSLPLYDRKLHGTITCTGTEDDQVFSPVQEISYDEFCMSLGRTHEPVQLKSQIPCEVEETSPHIGGTYSRVHNWRKNIDFRVEVGPPASPLITSEFPASPVAVIHPSSLRMSWKPNYDSVSRRAMSSSPELAGSSLLDKPAQFHDLYDAELEQLMDELSELQSSATSDSDTISVYVPPAVPPSQPPQKQKTFKAAIRWLPKRIKYTFLSTAAGRTLRR